MECSSDLLRKLIHDNTKPAVNALMVAIISVRIKSKIIEPTDLTNKFSQLSEQIAKIKTDIGALLQDLKALKKTDIDAKALEVIDYFSNSHVNLEKMLNTDIETLIENIEKIESLKNENQQFSTMIFSI